MTYKFIRDGVAEEVNKEVWCWEAEYDNGTVLKQFGDDGIFHQFKEIDQKELTRFKMVHADKQPFILLFDPRREKLIHFYKRVRLNMGAENEVFFTVYCFGKETRVFNRIVKQIIMLMPNGSAIFTPDTELIDYK